MKHFTLYVTLVLLFLGPMLGLALLVYDVMIERYRARRDTLPEETVPASEPPSTSRQRPAA